MAVNKQHNKTNINCSTYRCVASLTDRITASAQKLHLVHVSLHVFIYIYIHICHDDSQYKALGMLVSIYSMRIATVRLWTPKHKLQHLPTQRFKISERRMNFPRFRPRVLPITQTWTCRWVLGVGGNILTGEYRIPRTVTCPSDTSSSTNPTRTVRDW